MKKIFVLLFIAIAFVLFFLFLRYNLIEHIKCLNSGGKLEPISVPLGAPSAGYACIHYFTDGGKICTSNEDCQGNCLITEDTILEKNKDKSKIIFSPTIIGGTGECEDNDRRHPCYFGDFENTFGWCI